MAEKFSLKWNDYLVNVSKKFSLLRNEEEFSDVTLVSSDKRQVSAHKVVLSSCSDYFKTILLSNNKSKHIIMCLENISHEELNYMFTMEKSTLNKINWPDSSQLHTDFNLKV